MTWTSGVIGAAAAVAIVLPAGIAAQAGTDATARHASAVYAADMIVAPAAQDTAGKAIFTGKGLCYVCHGPEGKGTPLAPDLTDDTWLHIDGSLEAIAELITAGVPTPKAAPAPMPPKGGAALTDAEVQAVARYVHSLSHPK